jgi:hypothetical protein
LVIDQTEELALRHHDVGDVGVEADGVAGDDRDNEIVPVLVGVVVDDGGAFEVEVVAFLSDGVTHLPRRDGNGVLNGGVNAIGAIAECRQCQIQQRAVGLDRWKLFLRAFWISVRTPSSSK